MKIEELRFGNYIKDINGDGIVEVSLFLFNEIKDDGTYLDSLVGIPINEQWLTDFGFKKIKTLKNASFFYRLEIDNLRIIDYRSPYLFISNYGVDNIRYVHQLQNLYFALTGKELTKK